MRLIVVMRRLQIRVAVPDVSGNERLNGQVLEVEVGSLSDSVGDLKARLAEVIGLAPNKQKLTRQAHGLGPCLLAAPDCGCCRLGLRNVPFSFFTSSQPAKSPLRLRGRRQADGGLLTACLLLCRDEVGVMRDNLSLAHYNVFGDVQLTLGMKERGRGKK